MRLLDSQGIRLNDIQLRRPTLDDVFLTLTGRAAEDGEPETAPAKARRSKGESA